MISPQKRQQLESIALRISEGEPVSLGERVLIQKWAKANHWAYDLLRRAERRMIQGKPQEGTMDDFLDKLNLGTANPGDHLTSESSPDDLADFFHAPDHLRRD